MTLTYSPHINTHTHTHTHTHTRVCGCVGVLFSCSLNRFNNLELNTLKTVEGIMDFRRNPPALPPLTIMNSTVTAVESFRFLHHNFSGPEVGQSHRVHCEKGPAEVFGQSASVGCSQRACGEPKAVGLAWASPHRACLGFGVGWP